jgi:catechol 2,3-dioxygenase-like lactoylglutathione lyase family enzyme
LPVLLALIEHRTGGSVARLDHLALSVGDLSAARSWYTSVLGLEVEFDTGSVAGLKDEGDFTLILAESNGPISRCSLYFQVTDVNAAYQAMLGRGVTFRYPPQMNEWGYGAALADPDDRLVGLWDQKSMDEHGTD